MKIIRLITLLALAGGLHAAEQPAAPADPLAGAFFPPEVVMLAGEQLGLSKEQREAIRARMQSVQARSAELSQKLGREMSTLSSMARQPRVDEAAIIAQLDRVLDAEREMKHLHVAMFAWIKNSLTPEQQTKLSETTKDGGNGLIAATRDRLTAKVDRVKQAAQKMMASGRDPSAVARIMDEKVRPLLDAGSPLEAEAELDRILIQIGDTGGK